MDSRKCLPIALTFKKIEFVVIEGISIRVVELNHDDHSQIIRNAVNAATLPFCSCERSRYSMHSHTIVKFETIGLFEQRSQNTKVN